MWMKKAPSARKMHNEKSLLEVQRKTDQPQVRTPPVSRRPAPPRQAEPRSDPPATRAAMCFNAADGDAVAEGAMRVKCPLGPPRAYFPP